MTVNDELPATDEQKFNRRRVGVIFCKKKIYLDQKSKRENADSFNLRRCDCKYLEKKVLPRFFFGFVWRTVEIADAIFVIGDQLS